MAQDLKFEDLRNLQILFKFPFTFKESQGYVYK